MMSAFPGKITTLKAMAFSLLFLISAISSTALGAAASNPVLLDVEITGITTDSGKGAVANATYDYVATVGSVLSISKKHSGPGGTTSWFKLKSGTPTDVIAITNDANTTNATSTGKLRCDKVGVATVQADVTLGGVHKSPLPEKRILVIKDVEITVVRRGSSSGSNLAAGGFDSDPHKGDVTVSYEVPDTGVPISISLADAGGGKARSASEWYLDSESPRKAKLTIDDESFEHGQSTPISTDIYSVGNLTGWLLSSNCVESTTIKASILGLDFTKAVSFVGGTIKYEIPKLPKDEWVNYNISLVIDDQGIPGHKLKGGAQSLTPEVGEQLQAIIGATKEESYPLQYWVDFENVDQPYLELSTGSDGTVTGKIKGYQNLNELTVLIYDASITIP
jgi:hypothetical protein